MTRVIWLFRLVLAGLLLSACAGSVLGGQAACTGSVELITQVSGECNRTIETLDEAETQHIAVQTMDVSPFATVDFSVSVDEGAVLVKFTDARGNDKEYEVTPGSPATGSLRVQLDPLSRINFDLEPVNGPATGVEYQLTFVCDCMP
jgi:hypothetical protein